MQKRYQWQTQDMIKAGLNPMLAAGASPPAPTAAQMPREAPIRGAAASAQQLIAMKKQLQNIDADTESKLSQAHLAEASAQESRTRTGLAELETEYSGATLSNRVAQVERQYQLLGHQVTKAIADAERAGVDLANAKALQPLLQEYQRLKNTSTRLEIPAKEAEAAFWQALPEAKYVDKLLELIPGASTVYKTIRGKR